MVVVGSLNKFVFKEIGSITYGQCQSNLPSATFKFGFRRNVGTKVGHTDMIVYQT